MAGRGRPTTNPKTELLVIRVTPAQLAFMTRQAKRAGITVAEFVRGEIEESMRRLEPRRRAHR